MAVSGPYDGCGKTTAAINLAMALAECGRAKVLLVDANVGSPSIASIMRFVPPWCFASQLEKHRDQPFVPWGFVEIAHTDLHVAAIDPRADKRARLDAPAFAIAMERLRLGPYEHIVIDCPSVLGNADVNLIQDATDGVVLAARTKHVTARDIRNAVDQLTPTKILGTTLFQS
ncbi:MAG: tyrosine-protein kinase family protein [Myxococcales bacterium]|nr:tyrosine-protein kinase family protein [Myxococcales bacterium]